MRRATFGTRAKINTPWRGACGERLKAAWQAKRARHLELNEAE